MPQTATPRIVTARRSPADVLQELALRSPQAFQALVALATFTLVRLDHEDPTSPIRLVTEAGAHRYR